MIRAAALLLLLPTLAQALPEHTVVGGRALPLRASTTRTIGDVECYRVGLYLPSTVTSVARARDRETPKAFLVEIRSTTERCREELLPWLSRPQEQKLRTALAAPRRGRTLAVRYHVDAGTTIAVDRVRVVRDVGHALTYAFLERWLPDEAPSGPGVAAALRGQLEGPRTLQLGRR